MAVRRIAPQEAGDEDSVSIKNEIREFSCPITQEVFFVPVMAACGHIFEKAAILQWTGPCPVCRRPIPDKHMLPEPIPYFRDQFAKALTLKSDWRDKRYLPFTFVKKALRSPAEEKSDYSLPNVINVLKESAVLLNKPSEEPAERGKNILQVLCSDERGISAMVESKLWPLITAEGLNMIRETGAEQGAPALYWLASNCNPAGRKLFVDDKSLRDKITARALNSQRISGDPKGFSALLFFAREDETRKLFIEDATLRDKITEVGLNAVVESSKGKGQTALYNFLYDSAGRSLFIDDPVLRGKINETGLNSQCYIKGVEATSALLDLVCYEDMRRLLLNDAVLRGKINAVGLNTGSKLEGYRGLSVVYRLASTKTGRKILLTDSRLIGLISAEALNRPVIDGVNAGKSPAYWFKNTPGGRKILAKYPDLKAKIAGESILREVSLFAPAAAAPAETKSEAKEDVVIVPKRKQDGLEDPEDSAGKRRKR